MSRKTFAIGSAVAGILVTVAIAATMVGSLQGERPGGSRGRAAPEFEGIRGWINSEPLSIRALRGKVVLVDFWTYSCINCVRTFPHLRALHERYADAGLEVVGIHSPEFAFERDHGNVRDAVARHHLPYAVAFDDDMRTWSAYRNRYWPHVYLIDAGGTVRFDHIGEGGEAQIEEQVRALLARAGRALPPALGMDESGPSAHITPEVYLGSERGDPFLGNHEGYRVGAIEYEKVDSGRIEDAGAGGTFFLEGRWRAQPEFVVAEEDGARILLPFFARDVFVVASEGGRVEILLDGDRLRRNRGADVGGGAVVVSRSDLFHLIRLERSEKHVLTLVCPKGVRIYTFTFG